MPSSRFGQGSIANHVKRRRRPTSAKVERSCLAAILFSRLQQVAAGQASKYRELTVTTTQDPLQTLLLGHLSDWQTQLQIWATSGAIVDAATEALLLKTVPASLKDLNGRLATGDWSDIPKIELLSGSGMGGAIGAWAESTQTIYLNSDWLSGASKEQIFAVLTEEFGHYLDSQFNKTDTKGDEGELFSIDRKSVV